MLIIKKSTHGFTLIELSIVLVIIGLIVGGVLVGQDLIKAAQLRNIISQTEAINTAMNTFKLKYNCLSGDCRNAETFFGAGNVVEGDGNRNISSAAVAIFGGEHFQNWRMLGLAGLISGEYTGQTTATNSLPQFFNREFVSGINAPATSFDGVHIMTFSSTPAHVYSIGRDGSPNARNTSDAFLSTLDTLSFDTKFDDGIAASGSITGAEDASTIDKNCIDDADPSVYDLANDGSCMLFIDVQF